MKIQIQNIYDESWQRFGSGKIAAVLHNRGCKVSLEMVRELMRDMGLISVRQDSKNLYDRETQKYKNHINQHFETSAPNQVWVSDITYFKSKDKGHFICVIIDLYSRMVIACKISYRNSTALVKSAIRMAYEIRKPNSKLTFHTDRGSNYRSQAIIDYLTSLNMTPSFSRAYMPYDNSVMESFFATMKREELYRTKYRSERELREAIFEYIDFYNCKRPHSKLLYRTPVQFEIEKGCCK